MNRAWRIATLLWMAGILFASLLPGTAATPGGTLWHLIGYGVLGALWGRWQTWWAVWLLGTAYGAAIEGLQWLVSYRRAELGDLVVNAVGLVAGLVLTRILIRAKAS